MRFSVILSLDGTTASIPTKVPLNIIQIIQITKAMQKIIKIVMLILSIR